MNDFKRHHLLFLVLGAYFVANAIIAEFIGVKIFSLEKNLGIDPFNFSFFGENQLSLNLTVGVLLWPLEFVMTDVINEYYGKRGVKFLSYLAVGLIIYAFLMVFMGIHLVPADFWPQSHINPSWSADMQAAELAKVGNYNYAYELVFGQGLWIIIGSVVAFLIGQVTDVFAFHKIKKITGEKKVWLRATGSTLVSQILDSFVVLFIAFYIGADWSLSLVLAIGVVNYIYKGSMAILLTPLIYLMHFMIDWFLGKSLAEKMKLEAQNSQKMLANKLIMLRPAHFGFNPETAKNNAFQEKPGIDDQTIRIRAIREFDGLVQTLRNSDILIDVWQEEPTGLNTYDAVYLNNWFSTHPDNIVFTYPMFSPYRRLERKEEYLELLNKKYHILTTISLEKYESIDLFLESTGSMVIDHKNGIVYGNRSPRTSEILFVKWARMMGFVPVLFDAFDRKGTAVYHTNVLMGLADDFVIINKEAIPGRDWQVLEYYFSKTAKDIIDINHSQMEAFAGNVLPVLDENHKKKVIMSKSGFKVLTQGQIKQIQSHASIVSYDISTIESVGGGSVRCMIAENYLQERGHTPR